MKKVLYAVVLAGAAALFASCSLLSSGGTGVAGQKLASGVQQGVLLSGVHHYDTDGNTLFGDGGCMLQTVRHKRNEDGSIDYGTIESVGEYIYWYGEYRYGSGNAKGVSCYRSRDMVNWEWRCNILPESASPELYTDGFFLERPKVIFNEKTGKYVLWGHREGVGWNYGYASVIVAVGDAPDKEFKFVKAFRPYDFPGLDVHDSGYTSDFSDNGMPYGYMARDCTLFIDDDGTAYYAASASENTAMNIYRLTDDYLDVDTKWMVQDALKNNQKEAPCIIKQNGIYYCVTSDTDGWNVTPSRWFWSKNMTEWYSGGIFSDNHVGGNNSSNDRYSDRSQPAYIFKLTATDGSGNHSFLYLGDRWGPAFGKSSTYDNEQVLMKVEIDDSNPDAPKCNAFFSDALCPDVEKGEINYPQYYYIKNAQGQYMTNLDYAYTGTNASWTATAPASGETNRADGARVRNQYKYQYRLVPTQYGYMFVNRFSGHAIAANGYNANGNCSMQDRDADDMKQSFVLEPYNDNQYYKIKNVATQQYVSTWLATTKGELTQLNGSNILFMTSFGYHPGWLSDGSFEANGPEGNYMPTRQRQRWQLVPVNTADDEW